MQKVITRFAPSPTGKLHVGNIRTAVFAYLWAKHNNGKFLLRIEDTDRERFIPEAIEYIEESLKWLGLSYDGKVVYQSKRKNIHKKYAEQLVDNGLAYKCFCSKERLTKLRAKQIEKKLPPGYDGKCRNLTKEEIKKLQNEGRPHVIRFKMPHKGKAIWNDGIRGKMEIDYNISDDQIILKADGFPTYHLASIIDDHEAGITDVIRGEEWIPSTPKHIAIYKAFGWDTPRFSHMPHIIGIDKKKLSKRHGDTAILDYKEQGYLPEAMLNFLALLGWNDGTEKEIFNCQELIKYFSLKRVSKAPAVFDIEKLNWINGQYIRKSDNDKLKRVIKELYPNSKITSKNNFDRILEIEKSRLITLYDITKGIDYYVKKPKYDKSLLVFKKSSIDATSKGLKATYEKLLKNTWPKEIIDFNNLLIEIVSKNNLSNGDVFWPVRVALSGLEKSPSPSELMWVLGKKESLNRISYALDVLK